MMTVVLIKRVNVIRLAKLLTSIRDQYLLNINVYPKIQHLQYYRSRAVIRTFRNDYTQQLGTFIQQDHSRSSVQGKNRSASKIRVSFDIDSTTTITTTTKKEKVNSLRACNEDDTFPLLIHFFCHKPNSK